MSLRLLERLVETCAAHVALFYQHVIQAVAAARLSCPDPAADLFCRLMHVAGPDIAADSFLVNLIKDYLSLLADGYFLILFY